MMRLVVARKHCGGKGTGYQKGSQYFSREETQMYLDSSGDHVHTQIPRCIWIAGGLDLPRPDVLGQWFHGVGSCWVVLNNWIDHCD